MTTLALTRRQPAELLSLEEARERMLARLEPLPAELVPLEDAVGRVVAVDAEALVTVPPWDNSAMDGFAVRSDDVAAATTETPVRLRVTGEVAAGHEPHDTVIPGTAVRILTGAMVPAGADAVVPVETTDAGAGASELPESVLVRGSVTPGRHIRRAGGDVTLGQRLVVAGTRVRPGTVALLAAAGHASVAVHRRPRLAVISTGDELLPPGTPLRPAHIHDSNGIALALQGRATGAEVRSLGVAGDRIADVLELLREALAWADAVVVSGGVSVGAHDVVKEAFEQVGELDLWRVAVQPGKPLAFARAPSARDAGYRVLLFGLPGNPVSSFVTFELFVRPVLRRLGGSPQPLLRRVVRARLAQPITKAPGRRAFLRVRLEPDAVDPRGWVASLAGGQDSHVVSALAEADALAVIPEEVDALSAGSEVEVWPLEWEPH